MDKVMPLLPSDDAAVRMVAATAIRHLIDDDDAIEMAHAFHAEDRTQVELATRYGIHPGNVSRRLARLHRKLRMVGVMPAHWERTPQTAA